MEEEDKKAERNLEILKKYHKKETKSVKKYLDFNNTKIMGYGEEMPLVANNSPKNRALNRRAEIIICY